MKDRNFGQVVPFALTAARLRRGAKECARQGRHVEAIELTRRAAQEEDTPAAWLHLAEQWRAQGCWEQAIRLLLSLLARDETPPDLWLELGRCLTATGWTELAADCLYHYLEEDAWSADADEARLTLAQLEPAEPPQEPSRLRLLKRRGLAAWQAGAHELGFRRLRRALKLDAAPEKLRVTLALLELADGNERDAAVEAAKAVHAAPEDPRPWTTLCGLMAQRGYPRVALGLLRSIRPFCRDVSSEEWYLNAAWAMGAGREAEDYLLDRLRRWPNRIALLHPLADAHGARGDQERSKRTWRHILRLDPEDRRAAEMLNWMEEHPDEPLPPPGAVPLSALRAQLAELAQAVREEKPTEELIAPGSPTRAALDGCFSLPDEDRQMAALSLLHDSAHPDVIRYLRELLLHPALLPSVRRVVLVRLAQVGQTGPMYMLMGSRITTVQCQPMPEKHANLWRMFLRGFLRETASLGQTAELVSFAAELWALLSPLQRQAAAGQEQLCYIEAIRLLYLRMTGQETTAEETVRRLPLSIRRVGRVLRRLSRMLEDEESEESHDEVH